MLVSDQVINWTRNKEASRFEIVIGVAYGSNTQLVKELLIEAANTCKDVEKHPAPSVTFDDFGDSALVFKLFIWTKHVFKVGFIKSDIRFAIDDSFRKNNITIPFPQRDLHIISNPEK